MLLPLQTSKHTSGRSFASSTLTLFLLHNLAYLARLDASRAFCTIVNSCISPSITLRDRATQVLATRSSERLGMKTTDSSDKGVEYGTRIVSVIQ